MSLLAAGWLMSTFTIIAADSINQSVKVEAVTTIVAGHTALVLDINGYGMSKPDAAGNYNAWVRSITVQYPKDWTLVSVQLVNGKFLVTMNTKQVAARYTTFWINPQAGDFRTEASKLISQRFNQMNLPTGLEIIDEINLSWRPTDEAGLFALANAIDAARRKL